MDITNASLSQLLLGSTRARLDTGASNSGDERTLAFCIDTDGLPVVGMAMPVTGGEVSLRLPMPAQRATLILGGASSRLADGTPAHDRFKRFFPDSAGPAHKLTPDRCILAFDDGETQEHAYAVLDLACPFPAGAEQRMVEHMNDDHVEAMRAYCEHAGIVCSDGEPRMVAVDHHGFFLRVGTELTRFSFDQRCDTPLDVRTALVQLAKRARGEDETASGH